MMKLDDRSKARRFPSIHRRYPSPYLLVPTIDSVLPKLKRRKLRPLQKVRAKSTMKQLSPIPLTKRKNYYSTSVSTSDSTALKSMDDRLASHTRTVRTTFPAKDLEQINAVTTPTSSKRSVSHFDSILDESLLEYYENELRQSHDVRVYSKTPEPTSYFPRPSKRLAKLK